MPKLFSSKHIEKTLRQHGFSFISRKGSHVKYRKVGRPTLDVIIPANRKEIPTGTFRSILRQSGLSQKDFEKR
jgi:predicted RNA binding protein YcfA (HicA-like mRNA interferase family)